MKISNVLIVLFAFVSCVFYAQDQTDKPKGAVTGKVYFNLHSDTSEDAEQTSAFELTRVYLGYNHTFDDKFSAKILLDAGKNAGGSAYTLFIKNAKLDYKANDWLTLTAGIFGMKQFKVQEDFWGYRYLYKSLEDEYKFGSSADVGMMASMKISDKIHIDVLAVNGEGFRQLQDASGSNRYGINFIYTPTEKLILKAYYDSMKGIDIEDENKLTTVSNIALFAGYRFTKKFRMAAEFTMMTDAIEFNKPSEGKDLQGMSFYATYIINPKWNVYSRYDAISSNELPNETVGWNYEEDGGTIIGGVEFKPIKGVNTSVNYRYTDFKDVSHLNFSALYFNLEFYF